MAANQRRIELIAHRGESFDAPENTLAAINLAWERGARAVEVDVHLTADGEVVVCHDASAKRTCGVDLLIKESTLAELRGLDAGRWKDLRFAGERLPTLREVVGTVPEGKRIFVEIKVGEEIAESLRRVLHASPKSAEQIAIISFQEEALREVKRQMAGYRCYFLSSPKKGEKGEWSPGVEELIATAKGIGAEGLDLDYRFVDGEVVEKVKAAGLECYVWTCDDPVAARELVRIGVEGITSNRAAWLTEQL